MIDTSGSFDVRAKMKIPKSPPPMEDCLKQMAEMGISAERRSEIQRTVQMANDKYLHWHKFRFHPIPDGWEPQAAWGAVAISRLMQMRKLPITLYKENEQLQFWVPPQHQEWLHRIDKEAGGSVVGVQTRYGIPDDDEKYLVGSLMEEAIASSQLEGASTTREAAKRMLQMNKKPKDRSEQMILNNYRAIQEIRDLKSARLTKSLLCHLQGVITEDTLDNPDHCGRFRNNDDDPIVVSDNYGEVLHTPPPPDQIEWRFQELCDFVNKKSNPFIHPVIKAIVLHFALGFLHPFNDGNGRTARAMFYWFMLKRGYWMFEYLPISRIFLNAPVKYANAYLFTETDSGDLTYFTNYHLGVIRRAISELQEYMDAQQRELKAVSNILDKYPGLNHRQITLVSDALKSTAPMYTVAQHAGKANVTKATARTDLNKLVDLGLFTKQQNGKRWVFFPVERLAKTVTSLAKRAARRAEL
ncbi:MAG: Fic family protein [Planctomycetaceae bacterium]